MRILVVEDDSRLAELLARGLGEDGHAVDRAASGDEALDWASMVTYDVIVLDIMLPGIDGLAVCRALRRRADATPVLLLTAKDAVADRVNGLDAGADDYLVKPFAFAELSARLRALSRRPPATHDVMLAAGPVRLDPATREVWYNDLPVALGNKEFRILEVLMRHPNQVLARDTIAAYVWNYNMPSASNIVDVHVRSLRLKLGDPYPDGAIQTVRGAGYRLVTRV